MAHDRRRTTRPPSRGSMVVYVDRTQPDGRRRFRLADVVGPVVEDPGSGQLWVGVFLPDRPGRTELINCTEILNVVPPRR